MSIGRSGRRIAAAGLVVALALLAVLAAHALLRRPKPPRVTWAVKQTRDAARALMDTYYDAGLGILTRYPIPAQTGSDAAGADALADPGEPAALWGYSWGLAALEDAAQLPGGKSLLPVVRALANHLFYYWDAGAAVPGYAPTFAPGAGAVKFFDDNAWAGLDLMGAYRMTGDAVYLRQAEAVFAYEETGWDPEGGGIFWNDQRTIRNAVSNAPVAELAVYLYRETGKATYLTWAERIFRWEVAHLVDQRTGEVYENIDAHGQVSRQMWTYNQGTLVGAAVLLYDATRKPPYLVQARQTAAYALHAGVRADGALVPPAEFNGVLADDLQLLYQQTRASAIRRAIATNASIAWTRARSSRNLFASDWQGPPPATSGLPLLTQTGAVRLLAVNAALASGGFSGLRL